MTKAILERPWGCVEGSKASPADNSSVRRANGLASAEEIALADADTVVAQDGVGSGVVEIEVRHDVIEQEGLTLEVGFLVAALEGYGACFAAVDLRSVEAVQEVQGLADACLQLGKAGFIIGMARCVDPGQQGSAGPGAITGDLHLAA